MIDPDNYDGQGKSREQDAHGAAMVIVWMLLALAIALIIAAVAFWVFG